MRVLSMTFLVACGWTLACTETPAPSVPADSPESKPKTEASAGHGAASQPAQKAAKEWRRLDEDALSPAQQSQLELARQASKALGKNLKGALMKAVGEGDFAAGVKACRTMAPKVAAQVAGDMHVEVGRTSFKVRNPSNAPKDWQRPYVEAKVREAVILADPDGKLATMSPIVTADLCLKCHGTGDDMPQEVKDILAAEYPEDQAVGFASGDLRGWFWAEVSPRTGDSSPEPK